MTIIIYSAASLTPRSSRNAIIYKTEKKEWKKWNGCNYLSSYHATPRTATNERHIVLIGWPRAPLANDSCVGWSHCARPDRDKLKWTLNVRPGIKKFTRKLTLACRSRARGKNATIHQFRNVSAATTESSSFRNLPALALFPRAPFLRVPTRRHSFAGCTNDGAAQQGTGKRLFTPDTGKRG